MRTASAIALSILLPVLPPNSALAAEESGSPTPRCEPGALTKQGVEPRIVRPQVEWSNLYTYSLTEGDKWIAWSRKKATPIRLAAIGMDVTKDGVIEAAKVLCSEPAGLDQQELLDDVATWKVKPAHRRGKPADYPDLIFYVLTTVYEIDSAECTTRPSASQPLSLTHAPMIPAGHALLHVLPEYPEDANEADEDGTVIVSFALTPEGQPRDIVVECATTAYPFGEAVSKALPQWRYLVHQRAYSANPNQRRLIEFEFLSPGPGWTEAPETDADRERPELDEPNMRDEPPKPSF
jgi:TonB family protein